MKAKMIPAAALSLMALLMVLLMALPISMRAQSPADTLPDAPSTLLLSARMAAQRNVLAVLARNAAPSSPQMDPQNAQQHAQEHAQEQQTQTTQIFVRDGEVPSEQAGPSSPPPCRKHSKYVPIIFLPATHPDCEDQLQMIVNTGYVKPLSVHQKSVLAISSVTDPFNLLTIATFSGVSVAADAHTAYGPGVAGWGRLSGYSLVEDIQGTFTGVYLIPVLAHEDPRYHRMPHASIPRRIEHALIHTFVSQHDDGSLMLNYATLINYPLSAEISNLYVPDIGTNAPSTAKRVIAGYATDPVGPLIAEFLPDFAERVHIHIIFAQQILNRIALGSGGESSSF